jgi:hypothetical protein
VKAKRCDRMKMEELLLVNSKVNMIMNYYCRRCRRTQKIPFREHWTNCLNLVDDANYYCDELYLYLLR